MVWSCERCTSANRAASTPTASIRSSSVTTSPARFDILPPVRCTSW